jgi:hypothetical protein
VRLPCVAVSSAAPDDDCELCAAQRITEWFHADDDCWVALCVMCATPMIVWRTHDPAPPPAVKAMLHGRLAAVFSATFEGRHWIDDDLRSIPGHYHAHARPVGAFFGHGLRRRDRP